MAGIRAAGFVVVRRRAGACEYLLLRMRGTGEWGVPKGHLDPGESDLQAAHRETAEETGLTAIVPNPWFERTIGYRVKRGDKTVWYGLAACDADDVALSSEHDAFEWATWPEARARIIHDNLRGVLDDAAVFLKDPALRGGLTASGARTLLEGRFPAGDPVLAHTALVAAAARAMAEAWGDIDAEFVETCAWLHDVGRCVDHDRHPVEGFRLLAALGHGGYAPTCISHYLKGRAFEDLPDEELWRSCDLSTFEPFERIVALADFTAAGARRVTIEERHADLVARYGASTFLDRNLEIARALQTEFESRTGKRLEAILRP